MRLLGLILAIVASSWVPRIERGMSTIYIPGVTSGTEAGCKAAALKHLGRDHIRPTDMVVALRWPKRLCGSRVQVMNLRTGAWTVARYLDRGPAGADCRRGWRRMFGLRLRPGCRWRGVVDLTPAVARAIGPHPGRLPVEVRLLLDSQ